MTCSKMKDLIVDYYYHECSPSEGIKVTDHMNGCSDCRSYYDELSGMLSAVSESSIPDFDETNISSAVKFATGDISTLQRFYWAFYDVLRPAGHLLLPGFVSAVLCALTLGPVMLGDMAIHMSSELLLVSAILWTGVYTTLVSAIFNTSFSKKSSHINMRVLVYSVLAGCFIMNASLFFGLKGGLFSGYLVQAMSIHIPKALAICSSLAILVVATAVSALEDKHILSTMISIVTLYLAINIPVFFCVAGTKLTVYSVFNFVGLVISSGVAGILIGGLLRDLFYELRKRVPVYTQKVPVYSQSVPETNP